jgi:hypothetical protein
MAGGDSRFERPAGQVMAVGYPAVRTPPLPALWPIWRVLIGGSVGSSKYGSLPLAITFNTRLSMPWRNWQMNGARSKPRYSGILQILMEGRQLPKHMKTL